MRWSNPAAATTTAVVDVVDVVDVVAVEMDWMRGRRMLGWLVT
jgi:hypothetical protein